MNTSYVHIIYVHSIHTYTMLYVVYAFIYTVKLKKKNIDWKKIHDVLLGSVKMGEYRKGGRWDL